MSPTSQHTSFRTFLVVWLGQLVSVTGTTLTGFGLQLFVFTETRSVTQLTFVALAFAVPAVVFAPLAGSVIDRFDRRMVMLVSDLVAGAATIGLFFVYATDSMELWHIYTATAIGATANTFQEPAWYASISVLVPKVQLPRANGLVQLNRGLAIVLAPALAGALLATLGLGAVLLVDVATFGIGIATLAVSRFPSYQSEGEERRSAMKDARFAWGFLRARPGLFGL
ncbi:MAG: MFS transporter, partial [bacterium]|nr:MFS transporter [bacterium]